MKHLSSHGGGYITKMSQTSQPNTPTKYVLTEGVKQCFNKPKYWDGGILSGLVEDDIRKMINSAGISYVLMQGWNCCCSRWGTKYSYTDSLLFEPFNVGRKFIHSKKDRPEHQATNRNVARILVRFLTKLICMIVNNEIDWSPEWFGTTRHGVYYNEDMEVRYVASRILRDDRYIYDGLYSGESRDLQDNNDITEYQKAQGKRMVALWALHKYIEDFMRVWFKTAEGCKKGTCAKEKFIRAFIKGENEEVEGRLLNLWLESYREIKELRADETIQRQIFKQKSMKLKTETKQGLSYCEFGIADTQFMIDELELQLEKKKMLLIKHKESEEAHQDQRGAFMLPEVCKEVWGVYQDSGELHGEKIFNNPSTNTIRVINALVCAMNKN